jgi:hypothetical protein
MTIGTVQEAASNPISDAKSQRPISGLPLGGFRDPVVAQAIENVTDRQQAQEFWAISPHERAQAIYDEIKRLDLSRLNGSDAPVEGEAVKLSLSDGMTG